MRCGDKTFRAGPGAFVLLPRDVPHSFVVEGDAPTDGPGLPPPSPPDIPALKRVSEQYGAEIVGPPMTPTRR